MDTIVNLNDLSCTGTIACPYCYKSRMYMYGSKGRASLNCSNCHRLVLWDFDEGKAYKARAKQFVS